MKNNFLIFTVAILSVVSLSAQDTIAPLKFDIDYYAEDTVKYPNLYDNGIGLSYSTMSGYGLTFIRRFFDNYTFCVNGMILYDEYMKWNDMSRDSIIIDDKNILYNIGIEIQRDIITSNRTKIFALIGASYSTDNKKNYFSNEKKIFAVGAGFGLQWYMAKNFSGNFHFGYKFENTDGVEDNKAYVKRITNIAIGFGIAFLY